MRDSIPTTDEKRLRILVVDDEETSRTVCVRALRQDGHKVFEAPDAFSAMRLAWRISLDVAVVDLRMPDADGDAVMRQLRQTQPEIGLVAMTAWPSPEASERCHRAGADAFLGKPHASLDMLTFAVNGAARRPTSERRDAV